MTMRFPMALLAVLTIHGAALAESNDVCVGVTIGGDTSTSLACLNARLSQTVTAQRRQAEQIEALSGGPAKASPTQLNLYNEAATAERMGDAFGHSAVPQRPTRSFGSPLTTGK